ncbi:MAG TPA: class I SAM-dependent methyltransferase [Sulfurimonas sp.]|uniref:class I SAM-dependent methyltransferase n=1 Tax=Sulfurimonas sp. TaxID=2022749 RepID=UPI002C011C88|nr:class I SAM-dependent methyltransferase [Sulfurimonas sp.]HUH42917.1 class I SAM-dependent methyltransferase [Sulfurimonas sp.]
MSEELKKEHKGGSNPQGFDRIVREVFAPIYPVIAQQIKQKTALSSGKCLDAGCGTGALGRAMAEITDLHVTFFDQSDEMLTLAKGYAQEQEIAHRSSFMQGDIHNIELDDDSLDIVISRGSSPFWDDWSKAYSEILRVLKVGGHAYIGGGFGTKDLREQITTHMSKEKPDWRDSFKDRVKAEREALPQILNTLSPTKHTIIDDESGWWVFITK